MHTMEDFSYWNSQSPSLLDMHYNRGDMPILQPGIKYVAGYQEIEFPDTFDTFTPRSVMLPEADASIQPREAYQIVNLDPTLSPSATISAPSSPYSKHGQHLVTIPIDAKIQKHKSQTAKGRIQNREAQRRFRGRKEELQQKLQRQATELEAQCQELSKGFYQKSEEESKILKEKEALTGEIQDLRKRWRVMLMLLQLPDRLQSLSSLLGNDSSSTSGSDPFSSSSPPSSTKAEPLNVPLDELLGCLQELLLPTL